MGSAKNNGNKAERLRIRPAREADRDRIYELRHRVYAEELGQHPVNAEARLTDSLDRYNFYLIVESDRELVGCISVTPPPSACNGSAVMDHTYSIDKYVDRLELPFKFDDALYEIRLLTVAEEYRRTRIPILLMYTALRWIMDRGGRHVVGIGRKDLMGLYGRKLFFEPLNIDVQCGALTFECMHATVESGTEFMVAHTKKWRRCLGDIEWQLDIPFDPPVGCYHGGAFFDAIGDTFDNLDRRHEVINADVLDAWFDPSPKVIQALTEHLPWLLRTSPPTGCEGLIRSIAEARRIDPASVLPGAGSSDLIFLAMRHWLNKDSRTLLLDPTYGEYTHVLDQVIGCKIDRFALSPEDNYDVNLERLASVVKDNYDLVVLVNPNSPTGRHIPKDQLQAMLEAVPKETRIWIDETYTEYAGPDQTLESFASQSSNVIICKSMSKVYALSGARAAYLCGPSHLIAELRPLNPPWAVSLTAQVAAVNALQDPEYYASCYEQTHQFREQLARDLADQCGLKVIPGVANFLLCHLPDSSPDAKEVVKLCREQDLFIRDTTNMGSCFDDRVVRLAVKDQETNKRIVQILARILKPEPAPAAPTAASL